VPPYRNLIEALEAAPGERRFVTFWVNEDEQESLTFAEFRRRVQAQAARLSAEGLGLGERVVIIMPQGIPAMAVFAGAMMLGAVPAFIAYPNDKVEASKYRFGLAGVTANLRAKLVVIDQEFPEEMLEHVSLHDSARVVKAESVPDSETTGFALSSAGRISSDSIAFIQHSAGTTGLQKGVALTHAAVLRQVEHLARALRIEGGRDRIYSWLPLYHDMGLIACFMLPMACHVPLVMQSPLDWVMIPETMLEVITEHKCTLGWLPNFAFQFVARRTRAERRTRYDLSSLRALINCSEPVRASSMQEFQMAFAANGLRVGALHSSYAMAENVFAVSQSDIDGASGPASIYADAKEFRSSHRVTTVAEGSEGALCFTSSGQLLPNHQVRVISDSGEPLGGGSVGEILVKSDCLFEGYYNRPDLTAKSIIDGWYHTGDLGFLRGGELYVVGRKKDLIIVGGENIYPQDIEELAGKHPAIHDGRVIAMGTYNADLGTEEIVMAAEVERDEDLARAPEIEREVRSLVVAGMGVTVGTIFLKPPKWIVKSTAGKAARSSTLEKLRREHPEINFESI
jgi:fatty-acyl-CoA synthase